MINKNMPELLAPAGSLDALKAAVNAGADAVYLSGKRFGARHYAENFDELQMKEAVEYAHLSNLKVYVTVNTLVKDSELFEVAYYLLKLYEIGVDAVILQDVGVASICRDLLPDLDMHASTQMTTSSLEGVRWAYDFGFKRVVLSRELKLEEIKHVSRSMGSKIELELFAHGALCYSYSGQCLLSSVIGGRSGNRGRCAQPCRKPYRLLQGEKDDYGKLMKPTMIPSDNYLLSTRDLALYNRLNEISNLSLDSLKIEGRMRSAEYVALVVSTYRKALNAIEDGDWVPDDEDLLKLKLAFNRGFTYGYLFEEDKESLMGREAPGNRGLYLGTVIKSRYRDKKGNYPGNMDKHHVKVNSTIISLNPKLDVVRSKFMLEKGDGMVFIPPDNKPYGMIIEEEPVYHRKSHQLMIKSKLPIPIGSKAYQTRDISLLKHAEYLIKQDRKEQAIPLDINIRWDEENKPILDGKFNGNDIEHNIQLKSDIKMEKAINKPLNHDQIINQLKKTGGTPFHISKVSMDYPGNLFTPLSKLNQIRREFIKKAESELLKSYLPPENSIESANKKLEKMKNDLNISRLVKEYNLKQNRSGIDHTNKDSIFTPDIAVYCSSLESIKGALTAGCKRVYFEPSLGEEHNIEPCGDIGDWKSYGELIKELLLEAHKLSSANDAQIIWKWPIITRDRWLENLSPLIKPLYAEGISQIMVDNLGALRAVNKQDIPIQISGSIGLNIWNHLSISELRPLLDRFTLPSELSYQGLSILTEHKTSFDLIVQGNLDSLITEDCILKITQKKFMKNSFWGIEDDRKRIFPLWIDDQGRTHISNSVELCLIDYLPRIKQLGIQHLIIDSRNKTSTYAKTMVSYYLKGLNFLSKDPENLKFLDKLKEKVKKISHGGITTGNFIKGLSENS